MYAELEALLTKQGDVVYAALGTNVELNVEEVNALHSFLAKSGYNVLWSHKGTLPRVPSPSVKIVPWVPQQAVLRHPKVLHTDPLFILR